MLDELTDREINRLARWVAKELPNSLGAEEKARQILNSHKLRPDELIVYGVVARIREGREP